MAEERGELGNAAMFPFAQPDIGRAEIEAVERVLRSGWLTTGAETASLEEEFAQAVGAPFAVAVNSGTAAMHLAALSWGLGEKDAVILPAFTFTATAEVFVNCNTLPLILDVDRATYLLSAEIVEQFIHKHCRFRRNCLIHKKSGRQVRALVAVHYGGRPCEMEELEKLAYNYNLKILHDAAHAFQAEYKGKKIGSLRDVTAFSFYATKTLTTGEGGMLTTADRELAEKARRMRLHGIEGETYGRKRWSYDVVERGFKYNLSDICAAIGRVQLKRCRAMRQRRRLIARFYDKALAKTVTISPNPATAHKSAFHLYTIEVRADGGLDRDQLVEELYKRKIAASLHFIPLYRLSWYRQNFALKVKDFPNTEAIYKNIVSLPIYSLMSLKDAKRVVAALMDIVDMNQALYSKNPPAAGLRK